MPSLVLDASVALRWYLPMERDPEFEEIKRRITDRSDVALVPPHFYPEVFSGLFRRLHSPGDRQIMLRGAERALSDVQRLPLHVTAPSGLYEHALALGLEHALHRNGPDLVYLALADLLSVPCLTADARFVATLKPAHPLVHLLPTPPA